MMPRKQRTVINRPDPSYHSELPRTPVKSEVPQQTPKKVETPKPVAAETDPKRNKNTAKPKATPPKPTKAKAVAPTVPAKLVATREVHLTAAITRDHHTKIAALAGKGIDAKVPLKLAGRKAIQLFEPKPEFVEKPDADRMPIREGYQTTKRIDVALIDGLRKENDPFGLSSDTAMLRGQFEPLFWTCLDEVLKDLSAK